MSQFKSGERGILFFISSKKNKNEKKAFSYLVYKTRDTKREEKKETKVERKKERCKIEKQQLHRNFFLKEREGMKEKHWMTRNYSYVQQTLNMTCLDLLCCCEISIAVTSHLVIKSHFDDNHYFVKYNHHVSVG